jgi:hypothetical protein
LSHCHSQYGRNAFPHYPYAPRQALYLAALHPLRKFPIGIPIGKIPIRISDKIPIGIPIGKIPIGILSEILIGSSSYSLIL